MDQLYKVASVATSTTVRQREVLTAWKDIAKYVGKGVRTVQRWEKKIGLPVRRPKQGPKSIVLAFPHEIDDWVRAHNLMGSRNSEDYTDRVALLNKIGALQLEVAQLKALLHFDRLKQLSRKV